MVELGEAMEAARGKEETETGCEGGEVTRPNVKKSKEVSG